MHCILPHPQTPSSSSSSSSSSFTHQLPPLLTEYEANMASSSRFNSCFHSWIARQESDLDDLLKAIADAFNATNPNSSNASLRSLVLKIMRHFEDYSESRRALVREDPPAFHSPVWCSSFENSFLWIGGCRPTLSIRLVYAQSGSDQEAHLEEFLKGGAQVSGSGGLIELTAQQMSRIEDLHQRTLREEERMETMMETLQEDVADKPLLPTTRGVMGGTKQAENVNGQASMAAMEEYGKKLAGMMEEADELRIRTISELVTEILTPRQAVELLAAGKQLHLSVHAWGRTRDRERGRG